MNPTVALVAQGAMGSAVGQCLVEQGIHVTTSLTGRSEASAKRAKAAGMVAVSDAETAKADMFLSIIPPSEALAMAEKMAGLVAGANHKPIYVDCNAVNPPTKQKIGEVMVQAGCPFVDASIIGAPPKPGYTPAIYASGSDAEKVVPLSQFGLDIRVIDGPIGAAAALKMSYAGITKGITALASMMLLASSRGGVADALRKELELSQPGFLAWFARSIPLMYSKAYRFNGEMDEIADFVSEDPAARKMYEAFSEFYTRIAADYDGKQDEVGALTAWLKPKQ